jgi:hypothetical protein
MQIDNYKLQDVHGQHFTAPPSDLDNDFRTVPNLLRALADWMDENDIQDPEVDNIKLGTTFTGEGDNFYQHLTLYYLTTADEKQKHFEKME